MKVASFDFDLPKDLIAQRPIVPRDASRLLHIGKSLSDRVMCDLPHLLNPNDILVFNDTKVFPSRLSGVRGKAKIQITLHKQKSELAWFAFVRGSKRIKTGDEIKFGDEFFGVIDDKLENGEVIIKSTKRNYNAFALTYLNEKLFNAGATTRGASIAFSLAEKHGWKKEQIFISEVK